MKILVHSNRFKGPERDFSIDSSIDSIFLTDLDRRNLGFTTHWIKNSISSTEQFVLNVNRVFRSNGFEVEYLNQGRFPLIELTEEASNYFRFIFKLKFNFLSNGIILEG